MLKIKDKLGKLWAVLKDGDSEPELNKDAVTAKKEGDKDATVGRTEESGDSSSKETAG